LKRVVFLTAVFWLVAITVLHLWLNLNVKWFRSSQDAQAEEKFRIGFLPVT
jgi:hypothetical protein